MKHQLRSSFSTQGRRMAGARALWVANGMKREQMGKPIIAIVNSFTQFVPGHVHLHEIGQYVKEEIEKLGCFAAEFNTIAIDDGIAMGHDGMLYSLPSRDIIADSVEYMVNAHKADAMVCISNCDKITPGMLMAAMRLNIPTVFVSGGPMEAGEWKGQHLDLIDAMIKSADTTVSDDDVAKIEPHDLMKFGLIPEFVGRVPICVSLRGLDREALIRILQEPKNALVKQYQKLFQMDHVKLDFEQDAIEAIADKALERKTGARGLRSIMEKSLMDLMYRTPSDNTICKCTITKDAVDGTGEPEVVHGEQPAVQQNTTRRNSRSRKTGKPETA